MNDVISSARDVVRIELESKSTTIFLHGVSAAPYLRQNAQKNQYISLINIQIKLECAITN